MISNMTDARAAIDTIETENTKYPSRVTELMDADGFNDSCDTIEEQIQELYEKIRLLEDVDDFCHTYVEEKIKESKEELYKSLKSLEDAADISLKKGQVSIIVPFDSMNNMVRDRDGSILSSMKVKNQKLIPDYDIMKEAEIASMSRTSNIPCYNYFNEVPGTSYYSTKESPREGVSEEITFTLADTIESNFIDIAPVNCSVTSIKIVDENDQEYELPDTSGHFDNRKIKAVKVMLNCKVSTRERKLGDATSYDNSGAYGMFGNYYTRTEDNHILKNMERSLSESEKKYLVDQVNSICDTYQNINKNIDNRSIILSGGENYGN